MNNKEFAEKLGITEQALYKWKRERPAFWEMAMHYKNALNSSSVDKDLLNYYNQLTEEEKDLYFSEIKARVLRKKLTN